MKKLFCFLKRRPRYFWIFAAITLVVHFTAYWLPDVFIEGPFHLLGSAFDESIPLIPGFSYIYIGAFFFWIAAYAYYYSRNRALAVRLLTADLICKAVAFTVYCLYQCTLRQPAVEEISGFGAWLLKITYQNDTPTKLLPSMHCFVSILLALPAFSKHAQPVPAAVRIAFPIAAVAICASTLFVKQHVIADVWTAAILAVAAWLLALLFWRFIDRKKKTGDDLRVA